MSAAFLAPTTVFLFTRSAASNQTETQVLPALAHFMVALEYRKIEPTRLLKKMLVPVSGLKKAKKVKCSDTP